MKIKEFIQLYTDISRMLKDVLIIVGAITGMLLPYQALYIICITLVIVAVIDMLECIINNI